MEISLERNSEYMKLQYLFLHILHYLTDLNERGRESERKREVGIQRGERLFTV